LYGLATDNIVSVRMVLANGTLVTVSKNKNPDLYWAMRGAGHNFGVVTKFTSRIHDIGDGVWSYEQLIYSNDKLEELYTQLNTFLGGPAELMAWTIILRLPDVDPNSVSVSSIRTSSVFPQLTAINVYSP
jgi:hypothetical protein